MYSDYLCPPCRQMEPALEPILKNLMKKKGIRVTFVDVHFHQGSSLYARYFLYALKNKNNADYALHIRGILFQAAPAMDITTKEKIEALFISRDIHFTAFNPQPVFERYNSLIREDRINATPTCIIIRKGKKETYIGAAAIIKALKDLT